VVWVAVGGQLLELAAGINLEHVVVNCWSWLLGLI